MTSMGWTFSENYKWKKSDFLGKGATAIVYKGFHRNTGEPAAIKCFTKPDYREWNEHAQLMLKELEDKQIQELQLLSELDHENIIKLIGTEKEEIAGDKVAVMELCEGGSLFSFLNRPENKYGINEDEFLLLLKHSTAGLKYLRDRNLSHRDIKPGNILLHVMEEGRHIFKLADFGTARVILETQTFQSLCGTEQYLSPYMFEKGLVEGLETEKRDFSPMVDLWSMGCTLYHAATGSLPFQPSKKRKSYRIGMYKIHKSKPSDAIAAFEDDNGYVHWKYTLPDTCLLSSGLQDVVVCLLKKLLTKEAVLSFKDYFIEMDKIFSKKPVHLFDVQQCKEHIFYIDPDTSLGDLQNQILIQTSVKAEDQILIQKGVSLHKLESSSQVCNVIKETSAADPVLLMPACQLDFTHALQQLTCLQVNFIQFGTNVGIRNDAFVAELCTSEAYVVARRVESLTQCFKCLLDVPSAVMSVIEKEVEQLFEVLHKSMERLYMLDCILKSAEKHTLSVAEFVPLLGLNQDMNTHDVHAVINQRKTELLSIHQLLGDMQDGIVNFQAKCESAKKNVDCWVPPDIQKEEMLTLNKERAFNYMKTIRRSWKVLDSFWRNSTYNDGDADFEKNRVKRTCSNLLALHKNCSSVLQSVIKALHPWLSKFQEDLKTCKELKLKLNCGVREIRNFEANLKDTESKCEKMFSDVISQAKNNKGLKSSNMHKVPDSKSSSILEGFREVKISQRTVKTVLAENSSLIEKCLQFSQQLSQAPCENLS